MNRFGLRKWRVCLWCGCVAVACLVGTGRCASADDDSVETARKQVEQATQQLQRAAQEQAAEEQRRAAEQVERAVRATQERAVRTAEEHRNRTIKQRELMAKAEPSRLWIGIRIDSPIPEAVRSQLGLGENEGVLVGEVMLGSPGEKAGLHKYDVILQLGETTIGSGQQLIEAVRKADHNDGTLSLTVIQKGEKRKLEIRPEERPTHLDQDFRPEFTDITVWQPQPGVVLSQPVLNFPQDLLVSITKKGDEPRRITVRKGDQNWEITDEKLEELPADVRPFVEQMLGRALPLQLRLHGNAPEAEGRVYTLTVPPPTAPRFTPPRPPRAPTPRPGTPAADRDWQQRLDQKLEDLDRRLDELQKRLDEKLDRLPKK